MKSCCPGALLYYRDGQVATDALYAPGPELRIRGKLHSPNFQSAPAPILKRSLMADLASLVGQARLLR
jgi:hypothetical protein